MALERLDPKEFRGKYVVDHYARYSFATQFVAGRRVLDLACGTGYGTHLLLQAGAREVVGVDVAEEAVAAARQRYAAPGITFLLGDAHQLGPEVQAPFDVIVSFETIEHLNDPARWIRQARELSHDNTVLVFTVPNEADEPPDNPYHLHHYNGDSIDALLAVEFPHRLIVPYSMVLANLIGRFRGHPQGPLSAGLIDAAEIPTEDIRPDGYVAICRLTPGPLLPRELLIFSRRSYLDTEENLALCENHRVAWMRTAEQAEEQKAAWRKVAGEREQALAERDRVCSGLENAVQQLTADYRKLERRSADLAEESEQALQQLTAGHRELSRVIAEMELSFFWRLGLRFRRLLPRESFLGRTLRKLAGK